jgi:hypothetical protein
MENIIKVINVLDFNIFNDNLNVLIISSGLILSTVGFLYYRGYIFNNSVNNNIINKDTSSVISSEDSPTVTNKSLSTITSLDTVNRDNNVSVDGIT